MGQKLKTQKCGVSCAGLSSGISLGRALCLVFTIKHKPGPAPLTQVFCSIV